MTQQTLLDDYTALSSSHWLYMRNRERWEFLYNSYVGGDEYRSAGYLTRYQLETAQDYQARLNNTPLDNQCASVIQTYVSFLFREEPEREFYNWAGRPDLESFLRDADLEGKSFDSFMKQVSTWSSVFGHVWVVMSKPNIGQLTQAQEIAAGVRPYVNLISPLVASDWRWERQPSGRYELSYFKYVEEVIDKITIVKEWTRTEIKTWEMDDVKKEARLMTTEPNQLGMIPAILVYNHRGITRDLGVSDISDIADLQRQIYNLHSENDQAIRLGTHPTLVVPQSANVGSGAGAMIVLQEGADSGQNPYALDFSGAAVGSIHSSIDKLVEAIDRISFTGGVRATATKTSSGIALETEFSLLNAKLAEKADNLELAEEQIWQLFGVYQNTVWMGEIEYPDSFLLRDSDREFSHLQQARSAATSPEALAIIDFRLREMLEDPSLTQVRDIEETDDPETVEEETLMAIPEDRLIEAHLMRNPETGEEIVVQTQEQHLALQQAGWLEA